MKDGAVVLAFCQHDSPDYNFIDIRKKKEATREEKGQKETGLAAKCSKYPCLSSGGYALVLKAKWN
jgi:hypothetical protein